MKTVRDPKQCSASFDPRDARISTAKTSHRDLFSVQDDTDGQQFTLSCVSLCFVTDVFIGSLREGDDKLPCF